MKEKRRKLEKTDLDSQIVYLYNKKQDYSNLYRYFEKFKDGIAKLIDPIDKKLKRVLEIYALL